MSPKTDNNTRNIIVPRAVKNTNNFMIDFETGKQEGELTLQVPETVFEPTIKIQLASQGGIRPNVSKRYMSI